MYSVLSTLFVIGVFLIVAGFLGRVGIDGLSDVSENVAAAIGLLVTYAFLILSLGSFSELATFFEGICGGIPFLNEIADYGSLQKVLSENPLSAAVAFMDTVILSAFAQLCCQGNNCLSMDCFCNRQYHRFTVCGNNPHVNRVAIQEKQFGRNWFNYNTSSIFKEQNSRCFKSLFPKGYRIRWRHMDVRKTFR